MTTEIVLAAQVAIFGIVVVARLNMTSHLTRKRIKGFTYSAIAGVFYTGLMIEQGLYILAAMGIITLFLDTRGVYNNWSKADEHSN